MVSNDRVGSSPTGATNIYIMEKFRILISRTIRELVRKMEENNLNKEDIVHISKDKDQYVLIYSKNENN